MTRSERIEAAARALVDRVASGGMIAFGTLDDLRAALASEEGAGRGERCVCGRDALSHSVRKGEDPDCAEGYCLGYVRALSPTSPSTPAPETGERCSATRLPPYEMGPCVEEAGHYQFDVPHRDETGWTWVDEAPGAVPAPAPVEEAERAGDARPHRPQLAPQRRVHPGAPRGGRAERRGPGGDPAMRFRKKPVIIEAREWTGTKECFDDLYAWGNPSGNPADALICSTEDDLAAGLTIFTLEGTHHASLGDWIIKGVKGEFYPCKPDVFAMTYEPAEPCPSALNDGTRCDKTGPHEYHGAFLPSGTRATWVDLDAPLPAPSPAPPQACPRCDGVGIIDVAGQGRACKPCGGTGKQ